MGCHRLIGGFEKSTRFQNSYIKQDIEDAKLESMKHATYLMCVQIPANHWNMQSGFNSFKLYHCYFVLKVSILDSKAVEVPPKF